MSLDENSTKCRGRASARANIRNKPTKFGIRFYVLPCWKLEYIYSIMHNRSENKTRILLAVSYVTAFKELSSVLVRKVDDNFTPKDNPSTRWSFQMVHTTKVSAALEGRLFVTDNFYTRHSLDAQVCKISDE